eukprot:COSAG06_NODE_63170_length_263_cov_0.615854_1_plen_28_part_10
MAADGRAADAAVPRVAPHGLSPRGDQRV